MDDVDFGVEWTLPALIVATFPVFWADNDMFFSGNLEHQYSGFVGLSAVNSGVVSVAVFDEAVESFFGFDVFMARLRAGLDGLVFQALVVTFFVLVRGVFFDHLL